MTKFGIDKRFLRCKTWFKLKERSGFIDNFKKALQVLQQPEVPVSGPTITILDLIAGASQNIVGKEPEVDTVEELMGLPPPSKKT